MLAAAAAAHRPGRAPRSIPGRPSGLKAAAHRLRRRPAAGPDPEDPGGTRAAANRGPGQRPAPRQRAAPGHHLRTWWPGEIIYQHRCNDPLNPRGRSAW